MLRMISWETFFIFIPIETAHFALPSHSRQSLLQSPAGRAGKKYSNEAHKFSGIFSPSSTCSFILGGRSVGIISGETSRLGECVQFSVHNHTFNRRLRRENVRARHGSKCRFSLFFFLLLVVHTKVHSHFAFFPYFLCADLLGISSRVRKSI